MQRLTEERAALGFFLIFLLLLNLSFITIDQLTFKSDYLPTPNSLSSDYSFDWYSDWGSSYTDLGTDAVVDSDDFIYSYSSS
jgi:hypothetical protein